MNLWNLLLIDDEPYALDMLASCLNWEPMNFVVCGKYSSSSAALKHIQSAPVDAILTDIKMPKISGIDLAEYCYQYYPHIQFVLISAHKDFEYAQKAIRYNVVDYLVKPFNYAALQSVIKNLNQHLNDILNTAAKTRLEPDTNTYEAYDYTQDNIVLKTQKYIKEHFHEDINVSTIATHIGFSPHYFSTMYKQLSGENLTQSINFTRIEEAKKLLLTPNVKASNVFSLVGYKSYRYFFKVFKELTGMTPGDYQKSHQ